MRAQTELDSHEPAAPIPGAAPALSELEVEAIDLFIGLIKLLGMPKSVGELYGLLFVSPTPLPMETLMDRLHMSKGSASQGLKLLRSFGAVKTVYVAGDRRDHYVAEFDLSRFASNFIKGELQPHLDSGLERIERMEHLIQQFAPGERDTAENRLARLRHWHEKRAIHGAVDFEIPRLVMRPALFIPAIQPALEIPEAKWYCLRAQPKHEHIAAARLRQCEEIQVFCPRVRIQRSTRRGLVWFTEALFPNYLFARFEWVQSHALVRSCQGVSGIVRFGDHVPEVPAGTLEDLRAYMEDAELKTVSFRISEGDDVEIVEGPFRGQNGVVKQLLPARERVKVLLEVLGGVTEVDLSLTSVFKEAAVLV